MCELYRSFSSGLQRKERFFLKDNIFIWSNLQFFVQISYSRQGFQFRKTKSAELFVS